MIIKPSVAALGTRLESQISDHEYPGKQKLDAVLQDEEAELRLESRGWFQYGQR